MSKLFLCHSSADKPFVRKLAADLNARQVTVWVDEREILVGDHIRQKIEEGLKASDYLGIVLSPDSVQSEWVRRELDAKLIEEIESRRVIVLPILLRACAIPPLLKGKLYADFRSEYQSGLETLVAKFHQNDRETEVKRKVLQKLAGDDVSKVDSHQLMGLAITARLVEAAEELLAVHEVTHPGCQIAPQIRASLDVVRYDTERTARSWTKAVEGAVKLVQHNPVVQHIQVLERVCSKVPRVRDCVSTCLQVLEHGMDEVGSGRLKSAPTVTALIVQALHALPLEPDEAKLVISAIQELIRTLDRAVLRPIMSSLLHTGTHLADRILEPAASRSALKNLYAAARIKVGPSQEYSDGFLHLAWAASKLGLQHESAEWLEAFRLTVPADVFTSRVDKHAPLDGVVRGATMKRRPNRRKGRVKSRKRRAR